MYIHNFHIFAQTNKELTMKKQVLIAFAVGLCLTVNIWAQVPSYARTNGLVGYWPFNGNANDESGNGNNGTVNGATLTTDRFGVPNKAYSFDGVDDYILVNNLNISSSWAISFWFESTDTNLFTQQYLIGNGNNNYSCGIAISGNNSPAISGKSIFSYDGFTPLQNIVDGGLYSNLFNYHVVVVSQGGDQSIYVNSNLINSNQLDQIIINSCAFGKRLDNLFYFLGKLDDIGIWNRALNDCEIADLYNSQINSVAGSIAVSPISASLGSNVTLSTALNSTNVQWQSNPSNYGWQNVPSNSTYSGGNTNTLTINNVQLSNHNQPFRLIANAGNCSDTSNVATIQIADTCITNVTIYDTLLTTVTDTLIINTTLSLPAPNNENTILIYPNPASDHITIDNGNFTAMAGYSIKIENNAGQQVFQSAINQAQFYVDLSTWTGNGLYFVHLIDAQGNTVTVRKIILQ